MDRQTFSGALQCVIRLKTEQLPRPRRRACFKMNPSLRFNYSGHTYFCIGLKYPMVAFPLKFF